ncbi:peptidoglycan DD-metalloendopeptidase family protein [Shewanella algidipiscicola]|nr:peptidoglycan DD-metalloendopeptidase family protein [Shewanella algidipiscicola]
MRTNKFSLVNMSLARLFALPSPHKKLLMASCGLVGIALLWPSQQQMLPQRIPVALDIESFVLPAEQMMAESGVAIRPDYVKTIVSGDTLSGLFLDANVDHQTMYKVLEADLNILALDTLKPGNIIRFWLDDSGQLTQLELYFNAARQVVFSRYEEGGFNVEEINIDGIWQNRSLAGDIQGSFYLSAQRVGLNAADIQRIESLLKEKLNFARDLRAGDTFSVLMSEQYIDGEVTGNRDILGVNIQRGRNSINAYQNSDGNFYDEQGRSLARAFQRIPLEKNYRISSRFNRHRHHPVTGRTAPHNGTDFATPVGTKIVAPGDGIVSLVTDHRYAGKYVVIEHGNKYRTRYLHLSKALVHKGQRVSRGQVIALSGKTGRITGPHLHYEFHVNGRPVDPMKADIPMASKLSNKQMNEFAQLVKVRKMIMGQS